FARELRATRPVPREAFVQTLDARAGEGFRTDPAQDGAPHRPRRPGRPARVRRSPRLTRPAVGVALAATLAAAVALPLALSGSRHVAVRAGSGCAAEGQRAPAPRR